MMQSEFWIRTATLNTLHKVPYEYETGVKDASGTEIYEGDICSARWRDNDEDWSNEFEIFGKPEGGYWVDELDNGDFYPALGCPSIEVKIVGNIHDKAATNEE